MACKYNAPNKKKSEIYDSVYNVYGHKTAFAAYASYQTQEFNTWYGNGKRDENGEPVLIDTNHFVNDKGAIQNIVINTKDNPISLDSATKQIEALTETFKGLGIEVEVRMDGDLKDAGNVVTINGKTEIAFNPRKLRKDTIFHEFGHMYVDLLDNDRVVTRGIENLMDSELWNKVAKLYPELNQEELGKEVLTTAIGLEAARQYDERVKIRNHKSGSILDKIAGWAAWFQNAVSMLATRLGIGNNVAKRLAYELTGGKLRSTLTGKLSTKVQKQKLTVQDLINESKNIKLTDDASHYIAPESGTLMRRVTTALEDIKGIFNRDSLIKNLIKSNAPEWKHFTDPTDLAMFWADKREEGTGIHNLAEGYIVARNRGLNRADAIKETLGNLYVPDEVGSLDEDGIRFYSGMDKAVVTEYVGNIADFIDGLINTGHKLYSEIRVFDEEMGVAGTIDLLIERPDGKFMIYDWKTKEHGKFDHFYTLKNEMFRGLMSDVQTSKAREYSLQLSTYKLMLERKGFVFAETGALAIIPLVGVPQTIESETRYHDVALATNIQGLNKYGVLPLEDLTEKLQDVYNVKDDVEKFMEEVEEHEDVMVELAEQIAQMQHTQDWLKDLLVNLEKSISRIRASGDVDAGARYEKGVKELISQIDVADENMAIAAYTDYVHRGLTSIYSKFSNKIETVTDDTGAVSKQLVKGFSSWTWEDIKALEENEPKKYLEFLAFMINAQMFMEQMVQIRKLPQTVGKQMNVVLASLKQHESMVSDIEWKLDRLNNELDKRYAELSSNPLYGGRGVLQAHEHFIKAQVDESFMQRNFDAMADTHNTYMANVQRMYDYKMRIMLDEQNAALKEWDTKSKELLDSGSSMERFVDKATGKVITKVNYDTFAKARSEAYKAANEFPAGSKAWRTIINNFYTANTELISQEMRDALIAEKKEELGEVAFQTWLDKQRYKGKKGYSWKRQGIMYQPIDSKYLNEQFRPNNPNSYSELEIAFHTYLNQTLAKLVDHTKDSVVKHGYLPAVPTNQKKFMEQFLSNIGYRGKGLYNAEKGVIVNEAGEVVQFLPFMYNNLLHQTPYHKIDPDSSPEVQRDLAEKNKVIQAENKDAHAASVEQDLSLTMPIFIRVAMRHKHKKAMEFELQRVKRSFEKNHKIQVVKNGVPVLDKMKIKRGLEDTAVEKTSVGSNVAKHYDDWLRMVYYEEFENDEGELQKIARVLQNYTSFKSMAINPFSALNNQTYGEMMSAIEASAAEFFSSKDWRWASKEYAVGMPSFFADREESQTFSSKQSAFFHHIPIMMDYQELALNDNVEGSLGNVALQKLGAATSKCYLLEHLSEHNLQNRVLLAMAQSHRVVDGVIMSFDEFVRGKLETLTSKDIKTDIDAAREIKARNIEKRKALKEEFEKHSSYYDSLELVDGTLKAKAGMELKVNEVAEFQRKALGVNQYLHGIYNKDDAGTIQQYALGRLAIQFRKWMRPGWNKRWGTHFGKSFWNERRSMTDEGMYVTTFNFFTAPIKDNIKSYKESEEMTFMQAMGNIISDYARFTANVRLHWHTLSDGQKANVTRTIFEYLSFAMMIGTVVALKNMKGDDDDPPFALMLALYQADRTATELTTYVPLAVAPGFIGGGWLNESKKLLKSPTATFNTMEAAIRISKEILSYPFVPEEKHYYEGGVYDGEHKLSVMTTKMIPLWNQYHKFGTLSKNYKFYKLF